MKRIIPLFLFLTAFTGSLSAQTNTSDASMYKLMVPAYSEFKSITLTGVFKNIATDTLRTLTINWKLNNGPVQQLVKTEIAVAKNQTWPFTAPENLLLNQEGSVVVKAWVSLPNGITDQNHANDTLTQVIQVIEKYPARNILIEEVTGAWCGYCPRAPIIYKSNIQPNYPNTIFAAVHTGDGMTIAEAKDFMNTFVTGVPTGFVDRRKTQMDAGIDFSPEDWTRLLANIDIRFTPVDLKVYNYYDPATRNWKIDVVSDFVFDMTGNYRMNCYIMEDSLFGTGSSWDQRNFFNASASDPYMSLKGAGDPIPGYKHHHVVRKMLGGSWGQSGIIPATVKKGDRYVYSTTFKADAKWNMENVHIIGIVQQYDQDKFKRPIINAVEGEVALITGTGEVELNSGFRVFPNPVSDVAWIEFKTDMDADCHIQVLNSIGQEMHSQTAQCQPGTRIIPVSMKSFTPGIYFVRVTGPKKVWVETIVRE